MLAQVFGGSFDFRGHASGTSSIRHWLVEVGQASCGCSGIPARPACGLVGAVYDCDEHCRNRVSHLCSWTIGRSTREAQRSFDRVASCHNAGPFVFDAKLRRR